MATPPRRLAAAAVPTPSTRAPRIGKTSVRAWTPVRRATFLAALAETANVKAAAAAAKLSEKGAYALRRLCPVFRTGWEDALCEGYDRLELLVLERAQQALANTKAPPDAARTRQEEISTRLALTLLAAHRANVTAIRKARASASTSDVAADDTAARQRLGARYSEMHQRMMTSDADDDDTAKQS